MSPRDRARAAHAAAEATDSPADRAAWQAAAALWERIAGPGQQPSYKVLGRDLLRLRIDCALATGPFTQPPKAPAPSADAPEPETRKFSRAQVAGIKAAYKTDESSELLNDCSVWDAVVAATAYARGLQNQDARVEIERAAGKMLKLAA